MYSELTRLLFAITTEVVVLSENGENPSLIFVGLTPIGTIRTSAFCDTGNLQVDVGLLGTNSF